MVSSSIEAKSSIPSILFPSESAEVRVVTIRSKVSTFLPEGHNLISGEDKRRTRILSTTFAIKQPLYTLSYKFILLEIHHPASSLSSLSLVRAFLPSLLLPSLFLVLFLPRATAVSYEPNNPCIYEGFPERRKQATYRPISTDLPSNSARTIPLLVPCSSACSTVPIFLPHRF